MAVQLADRRFCRPEAGCGCVGLAGPALLSLMHMQCAPPATGTKVSPVLWQPPADMVGQHSTPDLPCQV